MDTATDSPIVVVRENLEFITQIAAMPSGRGFSNLMALAQGRVWRFDNVRRGWYPMPMVIIEPPPPKPPKDPNAAPSGAPRRRRFSRAAAVTT